MGEISVKYVDTGVTRCPMAGEWFRDNKGCPVQARFDFEATQFLILRMEVSELNAEEGKDG